jgi:hypothetical protein
MRQRRDRGIVPGHRVGVSDQADFANEEVNMSPETTPAELPVGHLGFGAMRITGQGIWGPPRDESEIVVEDHQPRTIDVEGLYREVRAFCARGLIPEQRARADLLRKIKPYVQAW